MVSKRITKPGPDVDYRKPLPRETADAFARFRRWLAAGCPTYGAFARQERTTEKSVAQMGRRNRWQQRAKAKALQDAADAGPDSLEVDREAVEAMAMRAVRASFQRCAAARDRLAKKGEEWELNPQIGAASEVVGREELNAAKILQLLRRSGSDHGGDRTGQHGPAQAEDAGHEFQQGDLPFERMMESVGA